MKKSKKKIKVLKKRDVKKKVVKNLNKKVSVKSTKQKKKMVINKVKKEKKVIPLKKEKNIRKPTPKIIIEEPYVEDQLVSTLSCLIQFLEVYPPNTLSLSL